MRLKATGQSVSIKGGFDMALITCPECGKKISNKASLCPNCGYPNLVNNETEEQKNRTTDLKGIDKIRTKSLIAYKNLMNILKKRRSLEDKITAAPKIRGFLILFGIFLCLFLLRDCSTLGNIAILVQETGNDAPEVLIFFKNCLLLQIIFDLVMIFIFFRKMKSFTNFYIIYCINAFGLIVLSIVLFYNLKGTILEPRTSIEFIVIVDFLYYIFIILPWLFYLFRSNRVRNTFIR